MKLGLRRRMCKLVRAALREVGFEDVQVDLLLADGEGDTVFAPS